MTLQQPEHIFLSIGDACRYLGVSRMTLLSAEETGLLAPARTPGGHRRYRREELDRFLSQHGVQHLDVEETPEPRDAAPARVGPQSPLVSDVIRQVVLLLQVEAGGVYLLDEARQLRFAASFGLPHWLTAQLSTKPAPAVLLRSLRLHRHEVFDIAQEHFPQVVGKGQGVAAPLRNGAEIIGVLFAVDGRDRPFFASEVQIVETAALLLGVLITQQQEIELLECQLRHVHQLSVLGHPVTLGHEQL